MNVRVASSFDARAAARDHVLAGFPVELASACAIGAAAMLGAPLSGPEQAAVRAAAEAARARA